MYKSVREISDAGRKTGRNRASTKECSGCKCNMTSADYSKSATHCRRCFDEIAKQETADIVKRTATKNQNARCAILLKQQETAQIQKEAILLSNL